ncbi:tetratricopeptide repeat protein [Tsuneonella sp. SYSU-LHT278]|uniref:tetratricopeptide repeat protein n=1 Tax=Tsuneonella sediminis TaxID=3416089 RepID=UPI003F7962A0
MKTTGTGSMGITTFRALAAPLALLAVTGVTAPAYAQDSATEARLKKAEAEIRALQRKVFPGGDGKYFEPQISAAQPTSSSASGAPSTTAVTDILARLDAMESQLARLTSQTEENTNAIRQLGSRLAALEVTSGAAAAAGQSTGGVAGTPPATPAPTLAASRPAPTPTQAAARPAGPTAERLAAVQAIAKPQTDDPGDDEYSYGFRLWDAGFYPEAQQQLSLFVEKYPRHSRISYGRNLLGRAYLDDGKAKEAAPWFLKNYQTDKQGARAPDSLLFLAEAMMAMKDTKRACIALAEFADTYPAIASGRLRSQYESDRAKVKCN